MWAGQQTMSSLALIALLIAVAITFDFLNGFHDSANVVATIIFPISLASYLSRFRPQSVNARSQLREANLMVVRTQLAELRQQIARLAQR